MRKKLFTFLLALVTSVGLLNAQSGGISVTEFNVPNEWESAETKLLESDLPGFGAADPYTTQRWNEVPSLGYVYLIYAFESDGRAKYHMFSDGVRYSSPTKNIWKPEIFSESNNGTKFYYTTGPSNWGPEELPQVSEITNPPSEWYQDNTYISTVEMPGFVTVDDEIVKAWDGAPQGSAILISSVGNEFKYHNFRDGVYQYTVDDPLTRNTVYFNITDTEIAGRFFYTTGTIPGGSTPTPANSCGDGLTWELNAGVFTISYDGVGTGVMDDFDYSEHPAPWQSSKESITSVIIPDGVTRIGNNAFSGAYNLASVSMGDDVVAIGNNAFEACNSLSSITLSSHVTTIGDHAFAGLQSLTSIVLPSTVQSIGTSAFYGNEGLTSITCEGTTPPTLGQYVFGMIGNGATLYVPYGYAETYESADSQWQALNIQVIGSGSASYPYCGDGLTWTYNNGVLTIIYDGVGTGDMLDYGNYNIVPWDSYKDDITSVIIPDGVIRIGSYAFANLTNLASVSMGDDVVEIGYGGFWNCLSLQSITLGSHVTTIGEHAFGSNQALTSITLPNTLQTIGGSAFYNCNSLPTITIPSSVTSFGEYAFGFCEGLTSFTCEGTTPPTLGQDVFTMVPYHRPLYVPDGYVETYQGADSQWQKFDISIIPGGDPTPDPDPTPSATGVIFANCYDCWRSPDYPTISGQCYLHNFGNPGVGNGNPSGPWKLVFVENYNSSSTEYDSNIVKSDVAISEYGKNPAEMEVYRLYQWQNGAYQPVAYGVLYAYANESNPVEHAAFFEASGYWGCYLTDNTHSSGDNFNILFNEDASTGFADLHGGSTNPEIKLYANFSGDWADTEAFTDKGDGTATLTIPSLEAKHNAIFVKKDGEQMSSGHNFTRENPSADVSGNQLAMWFDTDEAGEYTFTFEYSTNILTITYPTATPTPTPSDDANKLPGAFSVSGTKVVYFSKGNLQATTADNGSTWTWGFAEHQWDYVGNSAANNAINGGGTVSTNGAVDLFGWSSDRNNYFGIDNSAELTDYNGNFQDWGAKVGSDWRALNGAQWEYLLLTREPGSLAGGTSNPRFTRATILTDGTAPSQDIFGLILFPDNFNDGGESIDGVTWNGINSHSSYVSPTYCTTAGWATLESMGCVFLPAPGWRSGNEVTTVGAFGIYWSSTKYSEEDASCIYFSNSDVAAFQSSFSTGASVRLVSETAPTPANPVIKLNANFGGTYDFADTEAFTDNGDGTATLSNIALEFGYYYNFRVKVDGVSISDNHEFTRQNPSYVISSGSGDVYYFQADVTGNYSFTWEYATNTLTIGYPASTPTVDPAVQNVIDLINAIPNPVVYNQECSNALNAVYDAYVALSEEQRDQVTNYDDYLAAEERYYMLGSVNYVIEAINEIGDVEFTSACKHRIDYARSEYCSLTLEAKGYVTNYNTLLAAEAAYAALIPVSSTVVWDEAILETIDADEWGEATYTNGSLSLKAVDGRARYIDDEEHFLFDGSNSEKSFVFSCTSANMLCIEITVSEKHEHNELSCAWQETATGYRWVGEATSVDLASTIFKVTGIRFSLGEAFPEPTPTPAQDGDKLPGAFSVSGGKVVYFSKGNLQYLGNIDRWHFAENQWTIIGNAQASNNRDLFSWGTGDNPDSEDYSTYTEWGNNIEGNWRTLTVEEWTYLFNGRTDASSKYGTSTVAGVVGLILLPDNYDGTAINTERTAWNNNVISSSAWAAYEAAGAVFLPAAGLSDAFGVYGVGEQGFYWSSTMDALSHYAISVFYGFNPHEGYWFNQVDAQFQPQEGHSVRLVSETAPTPAPVGPTYLDADFAIDFMSDPYTVVGGGALPDGVEVAGDFHDGQHGYSSPVITIPVTAGNYLVKMGTCQFSNADGSVKNEDGTVTYTTLATNTGVCYDANPSKNYVAAIITIPSDQIIKVHGAEYTPYFSIEKMPEIPAFTNFELDFQTDPYSVSGTMPTGTNIAGTYHDNLHGYQNVIATVPVKAGKYRLTLGACEFDSNAGTVMSETNVELASFNQNLGTGKCYHNNTTKNIVSVIFDVDKDQHITIDCGQYTPFMKLEAVTSYAVEFALGDAEGTAPTAVDVTVGNELTMPVNKTLYKEGYTLTGWSDGVNTYAIGNSFTPTNDVVLTPVFTANEADLLNASTDVTVTWYFGGGNGAPTTSYEGTSGLLVAQATIGNKTVDVKLAIDATSGKFAPQPATEWAQVVSGTIFTYPYKAGMTVNVGNYNPNVTYYIADAEGKVNCVTNDYYSFIEVTYPASTTAVVIGDPNNASQIETFLTNNNGQTVPNLTIDRPVRNNMYNTLCLPFHMDADQIANSSLNGVEIYEFIDADVTNDELYLYTSEQKHEIVAGRPYLVKFSAASQLDNLNFIDVVINNADLDDQAVTIKGVTFKGTFQPTVLGAQEGLNFNGGHLFLMANNTLMWPNTNNPLKPFRAYFTVNVDAGQSAGMPVRRGMPAHIGGPAQIPTGVDNVQGDKVQSTKVMIDGVLYIIRDGKTYNAMGQVVK